MKNGLVLGAAGLLILGVSAAYALDSSELADIHADQQEVIQSGAIEKNLSPAVDAGNKICPVTGEKIDPKTKVTYEYKGKIYNFCCAMCVDDFKKNPEKYIKKVEAELKSQPASVK